ncbi:MAG TPA: helix-turn-helix transcriptional regulator [Candidatus Baltobacteraceae bacterium]|jgi:transcriptional regulator with XRE-family HTH domain|nr:helix-turn-helix transcriptional regulator [Candidatus Baltobacteraceae bacterium]
MIERAPAADRRAELSDFLRSRRARLSPSDVGLLEGSRRRTPGLRREEVALLANIGATWYTRLEQGLPINVSSQVLDSIARALQLTETERRHLYLLASQPIPEPLIDHGETVSPILLRSVNAFDPNPSYVRGRRWDLLAWNRAANELFGYDRLEGKARNMLWRFFMDPVCRSKYKWEMIGPRIVAQFRAVSARYPDDESFRDLIADLQENSEYFRRWWAQHNVCDVTEGMKYFYHDRLGELIFDHTTLEVPGCPDMRVVLLTAEPGSETERKFRAYMTTAV